MKTWGALVVAGVGAILNPTVEAVVKAVAESRRDHEQVDSSDPGDGIRLTEWHEPDDPFAQWAPQVVHPPEFLGGGQMMEPRRWGQPDDPRWMEQWWPRIGVAVEQIAASRGTTSGALDTNTRELLVHLVLKEMSAEDLQHALRSEDGTLDPALQRIADVLTIQP